MKYLIAIMAIFVFNQAAYSLKPTKIVKYEPSISKVKNLMVPNTSDYDVHYHRLELSVNPGIYYINGKVTTYFKPVVSSMQTIFFDFRENMIVDSVKYHGSHIFSYTFNTPVTLQINIPQNIAMGVSDSITVYYQGAPYTDGFGSFVSSSTTCGGQNNKIMWTLSEPYGSKNWWPCKETLNDKADSLDVIIKCPQPYRAAGNGLLVLETTNADNTKTYHWKHRYPIPAYLVAFAVADYSVYSDWVSIPNDVSIEVLNYVYPCNTSAASQTPLIIPMMQYYVQKLGSYPYKNEKYGHAQCGFGGGMEHSTMSFMGGFSRTLMAHELAHQWFGDKITCGSWQDIWLNEGFATYLEGMICEQGLGDQTWSDWKNGKINNVTGNNYGSTFVTDTTNIGSIFNSRLVYNKGALILHMLRWKLGDQTFFNALHNYINSPGLAYKYAKTIDFINALETVSGIQLDDYFNDWLYGQGWPNYTIQWSKDASCNKIYLSITQTHSAGQGTFFDMPVPVRFTNGTTSQTLVFNQSSPQHLYFDATLSFIPTSAVFDPDRWLCAKSTVAEIPFDNHRHIVWTGSTNNDWNEASNWDCGVPTFMDDVTIPSGTPICLVPPSTMAHCRKMIIEQHGQLRVETGAQLNIHN